ncbi:hypothetical protein GRI39_01940 [Altererythrobacter indicus]|uniref:Uncharacterized protein n=1 Tax=Altericroceibacterium indicum TaxID=374177 RepID=A0A845A5G9_9SPHN|nr:hypothetical protein [Altericroceibacterium indicum]MXP24807.1 hypothetical protein [Altericroceibacterium indicum]
MSVAIFDKDGLCVSVSHTPQRQPIGGAKAEVPDGTKPNAIWWDGEAVQSPEPCTLDIPQVVELGASIDPITLPAGAIAIVAGVRQRGILVIPTDQIGSVPVDIRGSCHGNFVVEVRDYAGQRKNAYPSIGDQLDALWKGGEALEEMQARVMAVKAQFPKE